MQTCAILEPEKESTSKEERPMKKGKGVIYGTGVYRPGEVMSSPAMKEAYEMGKKV
mgnify:CR=1 FL=1